MKFFAVTFFGLASAFSESFSSLPSSYYTEDGSMIWWKFPSDSSKIEYYLDSVASLQPGESFHEMWYWANNGQVRDGADVANYPRLEALMHGISDSKLIGDSIDGWEGFPSCDGPDCGPVVEQDEDEEEDEDEDEGMSEDMEILMKQMCSSINYAILSAANPTDYPAMGSPMEEGEFVQDGANCNVVDEMTVIDCDCSDAENYNFADQDVCVTFEHDYDEEMPQSMTQGLDTLKSLVCGNEADTVGDTEEFMMEFFEEIEELNKADCTDAQKSLEAEENFIQKGLLRAECESACAEFPNETCGFLVNGVSMILFAMLAMLKY